MAQSRAAILIRCTAEEAELIRRTARRERRTISAFVLNALAERLRTPTYRRDVAGANAPPERSLTPDAGK